MSGNNSNLSFLKDALGGGEKEEEGGVWNIFVQILLPLVLILTFVAILNITKYKDIAKEEKERARQAREELDKAMKNNKLLEQKNNALISFQLQKLLVALEKVKKDEYQRLRLNIFPGASRIQLKGTEVEDVEFKKLCTMTAVIFESDRTEQEKKDDIYDAVINEAEDVKDSKNEKMRATGLPFVKKHNKIPEDEPYIIDAAEITTANRVKIHNKIVEFVSDLKVTVSDLQTGLLHRIFEYLLENPGSLDKDLRQLADDMNLKKDAKIKKELAKRFHMLLIESLQRKIEGMDLKFHRDTWNNLKVLEVDQKRGL